MGPDVEVPEVGRAKLVPRSNLCPPLQQAALRWSHPTIFEQRCLQFLDVVLYFFSLGLRSTIIGRSPTHCVIWTFILIPRHQLKLSNHLTPSSAMLCIWFEQIVRLPSLSLFTKIWNHNWFHASTADSFCSTGNLAMRAFFLANQQKNKILFHFPHRMLSRPMGRASEAAVEKGREGAEQFSWEEGGGHISSNSWKVGKVGGASYREGCWDVVSCLVYWWFRGRSSMSVRKGKP